MCMVRNRARFARVVVVVDGAKRETRAREGCGSRANPDYARARGRGRAWTSRGGARANTVACILMHAIIAIIAIDARRRRRRRRRAA